MKTKDNPFKAGRIEKEVARREKEIAMTGTGLSKMFDIQNNQFVVVYCRKCGYSEFYNKEASAGPNILDLFFGG